MKILRSVLLCLLPVAILAAGVGVFLKLKSLRRAPERRVQADRVAEVRVLEVQPRSVQLVVRGYGTSRFRREIGLVPEVAGKVTRASSRLRAGALVPKDELLIEIEQTNYTNAVRQAQAEVAGAEAALARLRQQETNTKRQIEVMRENVELAEQDWERSENLIKTEALSQRERENTRRSYLLQKISLVRFENDLALIPTQAQEAEATLASAKARLGDAEADLRRTRILCPFPARVLQSSIEVGQVVQHGQTVGRIADITAAEIPVVIEPAQLGYLPFEKKELEKEGSGELGFPAEVRWVNHDQPIAWQGRVTRIETVDHETRTVPVVVQVDHPWRDFDPEKRPPFLSGMYCRVDISGKTVEGALVIPRSALREGGEVHVAEGGFDARRLVSVLLDCIAEPDQMLLRRRPQICWLIGVAFGLITEPEALLLGRRLDIRPVKIRYRMVDELVISEGLSPGDEVILSQIAFPVSGMRLKTRDAGQTESHR